jgi:hypothetical protein
LSLYHPIQLIQYPLITPADNILVSNPTERYTNNTSWTKLKEIRIYVRGTIRTYFGLASAQSGVTVRGAVFRNGTQVGTSRSTTSTSYVYFTEDIAGWVEGDYYQIYGYTTDPSYACLVSDQQIRGILTTQRPSGVALA